MENNRFAKHLKTLTDKGWFTTAHHESAVVDENFAQFFTFFPHNNHLVMASISVDRFYQLLSDTKGTVPAHLMTSEVLASGVCDYAYKAKNSQNADVRESWALLAALYMSTTSTGNTVMTKMHGQPFAFFTVMYPTNKKKTDFACRPASVAPLPNLLSVDESKDYCSQIMAADRQSGKKQYFKYLK